MRPPNRRKTNRGFTVIEALTAFAVVAVLMAVAIPGFQSMIRSQRVKNASFDVFASLTLARSEAVKRNGAVSIAPNNGDWSKGWTITDSASGAVLRAQNAYPEITITGPETVSYNSMGRLSAPATTFSLTATNLETSGTRCVVIELSGRAVVSQGACS